MNEVPKIKAVLSSEIGLLDCRSGYQRALRFVQTAWAADFFLFFVNKKWLLIELGKLFYLENPRYILWNVVALSFINNWCAVVFSTHFI